MQTTFPDRYPIVIIALHWLTALLFLLVYCSMEFRDVFAKGTDARALMKTAHYAVGLGIMLLFWLRIVARKLLQTPQHIIGQPQWQQRLAVVTQALLYALMLLQPVAGWLLLNSQHSDTLIFGFALPQLLLPDAQLKDILREVHEIIATAGYLLIGFHSAAALVHHYYFKDGILHSMLGTTKDTK